jgi:catechol 2,3-dioxygenase-like lactoylglutathione lyase family enzyme
MKLTGIHHYSVLVSDMERAVAFYRDVMGLQEIGIPNTFAPAGARVRWFQLGDQHIHLMPAAQADPISPRHVAIAIEDAQAGRAYFQSKGVPTREDIKIPGADRFIISDPDGNNIELIEWQETYQIVPIGQI